MNKNIIQNKKPIETTKEHLDRCHKLEKKINAFIAITEKEGLKSAEESEQRYRKNKTKGALDGSVAGIKDVFCTKGIETTAASKMLTGFVPDYDATVVTRLKEAGAVIIGKNNCDAWAHGASTEHSDFGPTKNPWNLHRVPGGSSGGSAAAVAAGECQFSIGSDTGGSIRQPAAFCGVVGLKPTYGRVSRFGLIAMGSSLDCVGPITQNVYDAALVTEVIAGYDENDSTSVNLPVPKYRDFLEKPLKGRKIGWVEELFQLGIDSEVARAIKEAKEVFSQMGAEFVDLSLPHARYGIPAYYIIQPAEVSSNLGRYDGIKYGFSAKNSANLIDHYFLSRDQGFGEEAKRRIILGTFVLSAGYYDAYYTKAMKIRTLIKRDFQKALGTVDSLLLPVTPTTAFSLGENTLDPLKMYLADIYTALINLAGNPAISLPCGMGKNNLPIGMQIVGRNFEEEVIFNFAYQYEKNTDGEDWRKAKQEI